MKKALKTRSKHDPEMLPEYDFSKGVHGKYAKRYAKGTNVVLRSPDVAEVFPDAESVEGDKTYRHGASVRHLTTRAPSSTPNTQAACERRWFVVGDISQGHSEKIQSRHPS